LGWEIELKGISTNKKLQFSSSLSPHQLLSEFTEKNIRKISVKYAVVKKDLL